MANPGNRIPRSVDTRQQAARQSSWESPSVLPDPLPREGFVHRWVRLSALGQIDPTNMNARMREGWQPVLATEYPEIQNVIPEEGRFSDNIVIGGLILCRAPTDRMQARDEAHRRLAASQIEAVDNNYLRESDPRMPMLRPERTSRVTVGPRNNQES